MKKNLYSVYDKQIKAYLNPLVAVNDAEAIRLMQTWVNSDDKSQNICLYPEQFTMVRLGSYDSESGVLETDYKELIAGGACVQDEKKYTVKTLINMIKEK
jgi:hypothetical protein